MHLWGSYRTSRQEGSICSTEMLDHSTTAATSGSGVFPAQRPRSAPGRIRTRDPLLRRQLLYPAELRAPGDNCARQRSRHGYVRVAVCRALSTFRLPAGEVTPVASVQAVRRRPPLARPSRSALLVLLESEGSVQPLPLLSGELKVHGGQAFRDLGHRGRADQRDHWHVATDQPGEHHLIGCRPRLGRN
jgi:hypothetical protein